MRTCVCVCMCVVCVYSLPIPASSAISDNNRLGDILSETEPLIYTAVGGGVFILIFAIAVVVCLKFRKLQPADDVLVGRQPPPDYNPFNYDNVEVTDETSGPADQKRKTDTLLCTSEALNYASVTVDDCGPQARIPAGKNMVLPGDRTKFGISVEMTSAEVGDFGKQDTVSPPRSHYSHLNFSNLAKKPFTNPVTIPTDYENDIPDMSLFQDDSKVDSEENGQSSDLYSHLRRDPVMPSPGNGGRRKMLYSQVQRGGPVYDKVQRSGSVDARPHPSLNAPTFDVEKAPSKSLRRLSSDDYGTAPNLPPRLSISDGTFEDPSTGEGEESERSVLYDNVKCRATSPYEEVSHHRVDPTYADVDPNRMRTRSDSVPLIEGSTKETPIDVSSSSGSKSRLDLLVLMTSSGG